MDLAGNAFLITGAAGGLGAATARAFVAAGARVIAADLNGAAGAALVAELGDAARFAAVDVTDSDQVQAAVDLAKNEFGAFHGVVHCAGILAAARIAGQTGPHPLELFERVIRVNLIGTFNVLRLTAAAMTGNAPNVEGERGVIVLTASIAAEEGQIGQAAYAASKAGVAGLTLPAARELARFGIRVVTIAPGVFDTDMMAAAGDERRAALAAQIPFPPRLGKPAEFAALARQIVENPLLNGTTIRLDGALRMGAK